MPSSTPHQKFSFYHLPTRGRAGIKLGDAWYVSDVSINFDCSMLYYLLFWTILGFIFHFYIIFGTNLLTMLNSINCSIVICSPTVEYLCSWEKPLVKPMAPGSILIILISITLILFCFLLCLYFFTLHLYTKNTKNILSIRSHSRKWPWRAWQPLIALVASSYRFVQVQGTWAWAPTGLIPWFSKTEGNTYATLQHHPFLFGENQQ
jgi:hypothetical protein